jgi:hypothetical protein
MGSAIQLVTSPIFGLQTDFSEYPLKFRRLLVTSAQLLAMTGVTNVPLVPAGGPSIIHVPVMLSLRYFFKTAGYTINAGAVLKLYRGSVIAGHALTADMATGVIDQGANVNLPNQPIIAPTTKDTDANTLNQPLIIGNDNAAQFTVGAGSIEVMLAYYSLIA